MQIYHTSHCGSTLLISLLSTVSASYSEPSWCHKIIHGENINFYDEIKKYENCVIKLPSAFCHFAPKIEDKKIFLYQNLKNHLFKLLRLSKNNYFYIDSYYEYFLKNIHPNLKNIEFDNFGKKHVFLWANRIFWLLDSKNVLAVNTNVFLADKKNTLNQVCEFFDLEKVEDFSHENYNVKSVGLNHNEIELSKVELNMENMRTTYPSYGIIEDAVCLHDSEIMQLVDWAANNISIPEYLI
jgi:hypothetical protein